VVLAYYYKQKRMLAQQDRRELLGQQVLPEQLVDKAQLVRQELLA
jgi:hypothetical protein